MKIGIVGWGLEGQSAYNYFGPEHEYLIVNEHPRADFPQQSDKIKIQFLNTSKPIGITSQAKDLSYLDGIENCDKIIFSVTSRPNLEQKFGEDQDFWSKAETIQHIFFNSVKTKNIIGVTGTKGKGTTSTLIAKMLEADGKKVHLGGNIGVPVLDFLNSVEPDDWVVLELSNFQLKDFPYSPRIAVCLMIAKEHQDWHETMDDYIKAKGNIFLHQSEDDTAIYLGGDKNSEHIADLSPGTKIPYFEEPGARVREDGMIVIGEDETTIANKSEVKLLGEHNLQNVCAAITTVWQVAPNAEAIKSVISSFAGLEHRLEFVRELDEVSYYDDSFGTTPETAIVAMRSFAQPKILILGGSDKGAEFNELADEVIKSNVKHVIAIGNTADKISKALRDKGYSDITFGLSTMPEIVAAAHKLDKPGDVVLLSTACASFGLFEDYKDRGNQFKNVVHKLA